MEDKITNAKIEKYISLTDKALKIVKENVISGKEKEAKEILLMAESYLADSKHFREKKDLVNSFAAINYAHGWIDCGVRLKIFHATDDSLFTIAWN